MILLILTMNHSREVSKHTIWTNILIIMYIIKIELLEREKARENLRMLGDQYRNLCKRLRNKLKNDVCVMKSIRDTIIHFQGDPQYQRFHDRLARQPTVREFFNILMGHFNYLDFDGILDHLIRKHDDYELKEDAKIYRGELLRLLGCTTIKQAVGGGNPFFYARYDNIPENFTEIKTRILKDPDNTRLIDIIGYQRRFASEVRLPHLFAYITGIKELNSFSFTWIIPTILVSLLRDAIEDVDVTSSFFKENKVALISMPGKNLYIDKGKLCIISA